MDYTGGVSGSGGRWYGVAMISRLLKIIGLFCRISSLLEGSFAKETCNFKEPTSRSHPIGINSRIQTKIYIHIFISTFI